MEELIWTAWNNGMRLPSGAGYGLKVPKTDRDKYFNHNGSKIILEIPNNHGYTEVKVNISKCHELICKDIGIWLRDNCKSSWPLREPPKIKIQIIGENRFRINGFAN